jgi:DNA modification methylase
MPEGDPVRLGDFYDLSAKLKDSSVDLIFTDPPYDDKSISLFGRMGEVAARVLKPGGSLVTYLGHMQLIEAGRLLSKHLRYWHPLCCLHGGTLARMTEYGVIEAFKPMLWFVKGTRSDKQTFIESAVTGTREKDHHEWQQAESEAAYFIERLSPRNGLVVDFFAGGGTTIVAAHRLNRSAIGYELNEKHWKKANKRILDAASEEKTAA